MPSFVNKPNKNDPYIDYEVREAAPNAEKLYNYLKDANNNHHIEVDAGSKNYRFGVALK